MTIQQFKIKLKATPRTITFAQTMQILKEHNHFTTTPLANIKYLNKAVYYSFTSKHNKPPSFLVKVLKIKILILSVVLIKINYI
jgi:hypothetical protein